MNNIDRYIAGFPTETRELLERLQKAAPDAEEVISYGMPAFRLKGILVYFAAYSKHIGFYPTSSGIATFKKELSIYKGSKGTVQFPLDKPLPLKLITKIVKFRVKEIRAKSEAKKNKNLF
jgi:uncharacterized protein YdhG (YjbR/CyaY superfamily)